MITKRIIGKTINILSDCEGLINATIKSYEGNDWWKVLSSKTNAIILIHESKFINP